MTNNSVEEKAKAELKRLGIEQDNPELYWQRKLDELESLINRRNAGYPLRADDETRIGVALQLWRSELKERIKKEQEG